MANWQESTALIIVDVQMGFNDTGYWGERNNPNCEGNIGDLLEAWRKQSWPIVFVKHSSRHSTRTTQATPSSRSWTASQTS